MAVSKNWSASRISTHRSCPLKYYYSYVQKWVPNIEPPKVEANKGLALHETVEHYKTGMPQEELKKIMESKIKEYDVDVTVYDEWSALDRFFVFWDEIIAKKESEGFVVKQESWAKEKILGEQFVGALDLFLENNETGECIIYDYKSAKTAAASNYKNQLILYAYLIGISKGWSNDQIAEKIKLYVFFPFSTQDKAFSPLDKMLSSIKQIKFSALDVQNVINEYMETIKTINTTDWTNTNFDDLGVVQFSCKWCPFIGTIPNSKGFKGCKASYDKGFRQVRGLEFNLDD